MSKDPEQTPPAPESGKPHRSIIEPAAPMAMGCPGIVGKDSMGPTCGPSLAEQLATGMAAPAASSIPEKPSPSPASAVCFRCDGCGQINMDEDEGPIDCPVCVAPPMPSWPGAPESGKPPTCGAEPRIESTAKCGQPLPCLAHPQEDAAARIVHLERRLSVETDAREWRSKLLKDYRVRMDAAEQSASALRQERDALRERAETAEARLSNSRESAETFAKDLRETRTALATAQRELAALRATSAPLSTEGAQQQTKGAKP